MTWADVEAWHLDGIVFGAEDGDGVRWVVNEVTGWSDSAPPRPVRTNRPSAHGSYRSANWRGDRVVTLAGYADVANEVQAYAVERALAALCVDPQTLYPLRHVDTLSGEDLTLDVELDGPVLVRTAYESRPLRVVWSIQVAAPDPIKYGNSAHSPATTGLASLPGGGVLWDGTAGSTGTEWDGPAGSSGLVYETAGAGLSGTVDVVNAGTADTTVRLTIDGGSITNPLIRKESTGETLIYGGTLTATDVLVIDTATGLVTLNGANRRPQMTRADFFTIPRNATTPITFEGVALSGSPQLTIEWADAYH